MTLTPSRPAQNVARLNTIDFFKVLKREGLLSPLASCGGILLCDGTVHWLLRRDSRLSLISATYPICPNNAKACQGHNKRTTREKILTS